MDFSQEQQVAGKSEEVISTFFDCMPQLGWIAQPNGFVEFYNKRFLEYTGYRIDDLRGSGWQKIVDTKMMPLVMERWNYSLSTFENFEMKIQLRGSDGHCRWFLTRATPVFDQDGSCQRWIGINTDIQYEIDQTQSKKQANKQLERIVIERGRKLAEAQALTESVIHSIADGIVLSDCEGRLTYLNQAARDMLGNEPAPYCLQDAAENRRNYDAGGEILLPLEELPLSKAMKGVHVNDTEMMIKSSNGRKRIVSVSARPIVDNRGDFKGAVAVVRDITARKNAEVALAQARDIAIEASNTKSQFLANMSHEIRTPMNGILGLSSVLYDESEGHSKELVEKILLSAQNLMKLLNDLLDLSKAEAGKIVVLEELVLLKPFIADVCSTFYGSALKKQIELSSVVDQSVPAEVVCDGSLVRQVLHNLIQNAIKFTDSGSVRVKVEAQAVSNDIADIKFSVQDTGIGISEESQQKLFQLFVQVDGSTTRRHGGTGLGLALSKHLVEAMHGRIAVESTEGQGSVFSFTLPLKTYSLI